MKRDQLYELFRITVASLSTTHPELLPLPEFLDDSMQISDYGFDMVSLGELERELKNRFDGRALDFGPFIVPETFYTVTIKELLDHIEARASSGIRNPQVVYVDDEEENLFVFKRKFGKDVQLKTFNDPKVALDYIVSTPDVALVITDEVMPGIGGNQLCDEVRKAKPYMKFILITGNPENDERLMYKSLRKNRFYEFIQKPVDFDAKRDEYLSMIQGLIA